MKFFIYLTIILITLSLIDGCGCGRSSSSEEGSPISLDENRDKSVNHQKIVSMDEIDMSPSGSKESVGKGSAIEKKVDTTPPIKPTVESYSKLIDNHLQLIVKGEIGAKVYIESMFYGVIDSNQELKVKLDSPHDSYFETFEIMLSDESRNDSPSLFFTTTFQRVDIDANYTYYVPDGVTFLTRDFPEKMAVTTYPADKKEVASVIMPFKIDDNQESILKLNSVVDAIQRSEFVTQLANLSEQELYTKQSVVAEYVLLTNEPISSINLLKSILSQFNSHHYYLYQERLDSTDRYFNVKVSLLQKYKNETYLSISVVPNIFSLKYQNIINSMINSQNIKRDTTPIYMDEEKLKAKVIDKEQEYANFLFVIDDSGSMLDYQKAISQTAKEFALAIKNIGMNFRVAIMTTSEEDEAFEILESEGIIENDISLFQRLLRVGTSGSGTETAIYNIELALKSKKYGDKDNGILTELEMPKVNEKLSIIILSDEPSSYEERARKEFDIENNPIVDRGYRVYLIGYPQQEKDFYYSYEPKPFKHAIDSYGLYGQLAKKTGGLVENIKNIYNYNTIMNNIIQNVLGDLGYKLRQHNIIESTIYVTINDEEIPHNSKNGWRYIDSSNSILFSGTAIPTEDDTILVRYGYTLD